MHSPPPSLLHPFEMLWKHLNFFLRAHFHPLFYVVIAAVSNAETSTQSLIKKIVVFVSAFIICHHFLLDFCRIPQWKWKLHDIILSDGKKMKIPRLLWHLCDSVTFCKFDWFLATFHNMRAYISHSQQPPQPSQPPDVTDFGLFCL